MAETIELEHLRKVYPGQAAPAVADLSLTVPEGEIAVLVGPSGCGKTTTMKMINRIIEPTGGRILLGGRDVTTTDPDELRRGVGYVIQQVGLFPHMTVAQNVATVPKMLGWKAGRIRTRVDELLELVGLAPDEFRGRYPKQLSGGQSQRVGVARALCADPPVMLMDEPFGAIDPISRERLQNEFLRLQSELRKTIVFVTHDIDEAVKMGDRIAILRADSSIAQFATPETILGEPVDDFVKDFIGSRAALRRLSLVQVKPDHFTGWPAVEESDDLAAVPALLRKAGAPAAVLTRAGVPVGWLLGDPAGGDAPLRTTAVGPVLGLQASLADVLDAIVGSHAPAAAICDERGVLSGVVDVQSVLAAAAGLHAPSADGAAPRPTGGAERA